MSRVLERVPGQPAAIAFLTQAAERPHHAYVLAGPEGSGKSIAARAFVAALVCDRGADGAEDAERGEQGERGERVEHGCGECRSCRLALEERHPNVFVVEPEGRDIHVNTVRDEVWHPAFLTAPEPGRKVFVIREADRLSPAAADTLLKVLEEPPADAVILLLSARAHELPETVLSRCHVVQFTSLSESFVVQVLTDEGVDAVRARLAARLSGGNLGRARRTAAGDDGLRFREVARQAVDAAAEAAPGALLAAEVVLGAAAEYKKRLKVELDREIAPFLDEGGRPQDAYRGAVKRIETRFRRRERRAERDYIDWVLLGMSSLLRDRVAAAVGGDETVWMNPDITPDGAFSIDRSVRALASVENARAALAEDLNLNARLVLERAFLELSERV